MKAPFRPETNFSHSNAGALWLHKYFLKCAREILHPTRATFKTTSPSSVG